jgi:hypothetical protein
MPYILCYLPPSIYTVPCFILLPSAFQLYHASFFYLPPSSYTMLLSVTFWSPSCAMLHFASFLLSLAPFLILLPTASLSHHASLCYLQYCLPFAQCFILLPSASLLHHASFCYLLPPSCTMPHSATFCLPLAPCFILLPSAFLVHYASVCYLLVSLLRHASFC